MVLPVVYFLGSTDNPGDMEWCSHVILMCRLHLRQLANLAANLGLSCTTPQQEHLNDTQPPPLRL